LLEHRRDRRALSGAGHAGQQDQPLVVAAEPLDRGGQKQTFEVGDRVVDAAGHEAERALLGQEIDAKSPAHAVDHGDVGKVAAPVGLENRAPAIVEHRQAEPLHLLVVDARGLEPLERALDANDRWLTHLEMQIAALELDQRVEQPVDLQPRAGRRVGLD